MQKWFKVWKEKTFTSDDIHLGHYKALLASDGMQYNDGDDPAQRLWQIIYAIINASIQCGKGPDRQNKVLQLTMEKNRGTIEYFVFDELIIIKQTTTSF